MAAWSLQRALVDENQAFKKYHHAHYRFPQALFWGLNIEVQFLL